MSGKRRIVGLHAAQSALEHTPDKLATAWLDAGRMDARLSRIKQELEAAGVSIHLANRKELDRLSEGRNHQGVIVEVEMARELGESDLRDVLDTLAGPAFFLVLDHVQDPHNLGACLRTADAAGVHGVIITKDQSAGITPTVAKVASGAAETVPLFKVTNLARALGWLKEAGIWIVGAAGEADKTVYQTDLNMPLALVLGAEEKGMRRLTREHCDFLVKIPMLGQVESLNVSVATGILLFEAVRQRGQV
ncbi:MAG: 23S rRNA (guanosine(2251)-2'-O)-methyltransferase RlmB [Proteobacteria bacterium]|nr:23S rRNA (guanosine(2251)-2'-O)-methyltransferase RlmB [Pseudomonadota bacterium]